MTTLLWLLLAQHDLIHISDTHVAALTGAHPDLVQARALHTQSHHRLADFATAVNQLTNATIVHTGDAVDAVCFDSAAGPDLYGQIDLLRRSLRGVQHKIHLALGNHDVECYRRDPKKPATAVGDQSAATQLRKRWRRHPYYATRLPYGYRLILLDNGQSFAAGGRPYFERQMQWLARELRRHPRNPTLIALHIPLSTDEASQLVLAELARAPQVQLVLCGHRHTDAVDSLPLGSRTLLQVRTAALFLSANNWRRIRLWPDRLEVSATAHPDQILTTVTPVSVPSRNP